MPYIFPHEELFVYFISGLIAILLVVRVILARRINRRHLEARHREGADPAVH